MAELTGPSISYGGHLAALLLPDSPGSPPLHRLLHLPRRNLHPHKPHPDFAATACRLRFSRWQGEVDSNGRNDW